MLKSDRWSKNGLFWRQAMSKSKRISQETFDAAVKENIDDFGLSAEEAIQDTIKEFQLQVFAEVHVAASS
jgi:hypothetical protein